MESESVQLRSVAVPTEHGGWSFTLEPVALGLMVAPSWAGAALGGVALLAFLARTPVKLALIDRHRGRRLPRTQMAERVAAAEFVLLGALLAVAVATAEEPFWWPLVMALPLVGIELWYDIRSRSRRLVPELAGTVGVASMAAAVSLAGGADTSVAAGLWVVAGARAVAAVPFVRLQLRRAKNQPYRVVSSDAAQAVAVGAVVAAAVAEVAPVAGAIITVVVAVVHLVLARRPVPAVPVLGAQQMVVGLTVVLVTALGALTQFS